MSLEDRRLRDLVEADIHQLIVSGVAEHLYLEYKSDLYGENLAGRKEFLLDVCMFANAQGGVLLIGVAEERDVQGQPTGLPNASLPLGVEITNPESLLLSYDARIVSCIEERLQVESFAIPVSGGRHVLAFRVPDSTSKPHCVRLEGHVYFPCRRERHKYFMDVREIKELSVRATSQLERAEAVVKSILSVGALPGEPTLIVSLVPVFFKDFLVNVKDPTIYQAFGNFHMSLTGSNFTAPVYTLDGLRRSSTRFPVELGRRGTITLRAVIATAPNSPPGTFHFCANAIDVILRAFMKRAQILCQAAAIPPPLLLGSAIATPQTLAAMYAAGTPEAQVGAGIHLLPLLEIGNLFEPADKIIRPLCDVAHQMFGKKESPCFGPDGLWVGPTV